MNNYYHRAIGQTSEHNKFSEIQEF